MSCFIFSHSKIILVLVLVSELFIHGNYDDAASIGLYVIKVYDLLVL